LFSLVIQKISSIFNKLSLEIVKILVKSDFLEISIFSNDSFSQVLDNSRLFSKLILFFSKPDKLFFKDSICFFKSFCHKLDDFLVNSMFFSKIFFCSHKLFICLSKLDI